MTRAELIELCRQYKKIEQELAPILSHRDTLRSKIVNAAPPFTIVLEGVLLEHQAEWEHVQINRANFFDLAKSFPLQDAMDIVTIPASVRIRVLPDQDKEP